MKFFITLLAITVATIIGCSNSNINDPTIKRADTEKTKQKAKDALAFCKSKNFSTDFCILIDMSVHSGLNRFFVWDFQKDTISYSCLVGHGCGDNRWSSDQSKDHPTFSNKDGSHLSALGKYKLGERAHSDWGIHIKYQMHGLEATNNNALARTIVFHSWDEVEDEEIYPDGTAEGWGCPTISNTSMTRLDPKLMASEKPVLMWIYN